MTTTDNTTDLLHVFDSIEVRNEEKISSIPQQIPQERCREINEKTKTKN